MVDEGKEPRAKFSHLNSHRKPKATPADSERGAVGAHPWALSAESTQEEASELEQKAKVVWVTPLVTLEKRVRRIPSELRENGF